MPECQNCGAHVTEDYVRVMEPDSIDQPKACPACEDLVRSRGEVREARSSRTTARRVRE